MYQESHGLTHYLKTQCQVLRKIPQNTAFFFIGLNDNLVLTLFLINSMHFMENPL